MQSKSVAALLTQILLICENQRFAFAKALRGHGIRDAAKNEFSFVVSIGSIDKFAYADEKHICTGALISRWHVLTAGHCVDNPQQPKIQVTIGSVNLRAGRAFYSDKWITYDQWAQLRRIDTAFETNDIAILKLRKEVNEAAIVPAKVWKGSNQELYRKTAVLAGWGQTNEFDEPSAILQVANVTIRTNVECSKSRDSCSAKPANLIIQSRFLCSKADPYVLMGAGDSGGPLIYEKNTIAGVGGGICPPSPNLNPDIAIGVINKRRVNLHTSTTFYKIFIDDCLENF